MFARISSMIKKIDAAIDRIIDNIAKVFITPEAARKQKTNKFTHGMGMSYF